MSMSEAPEHSPFGMSKRAKRSSCDACPEKASDERSPTIPLVGAGLCSVNERVEDKGGSCRHVTLIDSSAWSTPPPLRSALFPVSRIDFRTSRPTLAQRAAFFVHAEE